MNKKKLLVLSGMFFALALTACNGGGNNSSEELDNTVDVFVLSGQSNMEGSTYYDNGKQWLQKACERLEIDSEPMFEGFDNIYTSYYGYYPYGGNNPTPHASNKTNPLAGEFQNTKVGMGNRDDFMGPEIGIAHALQRKATEDRPIYFIKCAFSGSGFNANTNQGNWVIDPATGNASSGGYSASKNLYDNKLKPFTENNLRLIEETGKTPVIRGFLWHQGETDSGNNNYYDQMMGLIARFREDFADYAIDEDGDNIAFVDGYIYDGPNSPYHSQSKATNLSINDKKQQIAEAGDNNFVINTSYCKQYGFSLEEDGGPMKLDIGLRQGDVEGGCDTYHYKTYDDLRMGIAYGECVIQNVLGE